MASHPVHVGRLLHGLAGEVEAGVRDHHALGPAGRAAGVQEHRQVVVVARDDRHRIGLLERAQREHAIW